ncbi:hypothetical protein VTN77DRAFT_4715 [Rasamsonia byssochlamydoides]|uniref:uncharacterized protein n=1 Tax=Rasamsonia byssochlamydoides TaxID=89139 RepID=UPI0037445AE6
MGLQGTAICLLVTTSCGLQYMLYGYDQGFMSGVLIAEDFLATMDQPSTFIQGLMASIYDVGCFFGCAVSMVFSQKLGRRYPIIVGTIVVVAGAVIQTASQAETLPATKRERFGTLQYLLVCTGASVSYWMNYALSYGGGQFEWRFAIAAQLVFAVTLLVIIPFMLESPRWLIMQDRNEEAVAIVKRMHGVTDDNDDENLRRIMLGWWMMAMEMWSGVCSIGYYISYLFETSVGLSHNLSLLLSGFNGLWYLASAIIPFFVIDRIGKRWCLMIGIFGMGCCFLTMSLTIRDGSFGASIVCVIAFFLYYTFFSIGWLAIPWLYCAEILPLHLRSIGNSITTSSNWLHNYITVLLTPSIMGNLRWKGYLLFTVCNFAWVLVVFVFYPETTGRRLEEIDAIFFRTSPVVCGTKWARKGHFETDELDHAILNAGAGKVGREYTGEVERRSYVNEKQAQA